ncbi:unnamed protein product [Clavelina lepadiformis]|uniref:Uncharacterized protein n=1 Tax=Clavelina lepadiformis TaxID=159417 RepID=A0ABP0G7Y6_CLALP
MNYGMYLRNTTLFKICTGPNLLSGPGSTMRSTRPCSRSTCKNVGSFKFANPPLLLGFATSDTLFHSWSNEVILTAPLKAFCPGKCTGPSTKIKMPVCYCTHTALVQYLS